MAFTDYETEQLHKALLKETRRCAVTLGMKKTSVDQLTKAIGIAKGSFYKFYESKEMAFFAVLESIHSELYGVADHALSEANGLPPSERAAKAVLAVCRRLSDTGDMVFIENDAKLLLQRLPEDVKNIHYHDDEAHIRQLLDCAESRHLFGCRHGAGTDPHRFSQGADWRTVPTGAGNVGVRRMQGVI